MKMRRAGKKWREGAPETVVDCFFHPKFIDCFTIFVDDGRDDEYITYLGTSPNLGYSGWQEMPIWTAREYRYANGHYRICWDDVPEKVQKAIIQDITN
jgi:hypothetical protein